jgi:hypothetical protein
MERRLAELSFDGEMLVEMNENQQDSEDEAVRLFHVVVHRFCHAFCQHHNDDNEELGETKQVEINQIRKEIVMCGQCIVQWTSCNGIALKKCLILGPITMIERG